jgi:hypothetical protein
MRAKFSASIILLLCITLISAEKEINKAECEFCDLIVYRINYLRNENNLEKIPDLMDNLCSSTNDIYLQYMCELFSNDFVLTILHLLDDGYKTYQICDAMDLCNIYSNDYVVFNEDKLVCEFIYSSLLNDSNILHYIDDEINRDEYIGKTCSELGGIYNAKCENLLLTKGDYIKNSIMNNKGMNRTCSNILLNIADDIDFHIYEL